MKEFGEMIKKEKRGFIIIAMEIGMKETGEMG